MTRQEAIKKIRDAWPSADERYANGRIKELEALGLLKFEEEKKTIELPTSWQKILTPEQIIAISTLLITEGYKIVKDAK